MSFIPLPNLTYARTYRFAAEHIEKLAHLSSTLRKDQSEIVREALDEYYERHSKPTPQPASEQQA